MEHKSQYGDRKTVGAIYRDAQIHGDKSPIQAGDLTNELMSSLVSDLNDTIQSRPFDGECDYYITVHEKKDRQMPRALLRRIITTKYRPYPEDDTVVFKIHRNGDIRFCWCLPHWSEMDNMLANEALFDYDMLKEIKAWKNLNLEHFGFMKDEMGNWTANPHYQDAKLTEFYKKPPKILVA